jgi:hypothetical protein
MVGLGSQAKKETEINSNPDVWSLRPKLFPPQYAQVRGSHVYN